MLLQGAVVTMSSFIPSNKENVYANCGDDDESTAETNSLNHSTLEDNEMNEGIYSSEPYKRNIPSHKQKRLRKILKRLVFGIVTLIAIIALCLAVRSESCCCLVLGFDDFLRLRASKSMVSHKQIQNIII